MHDHFTKNVADTALAVLPAAGGTTGNAATRASTCGRGGDTFGGRWRPRLVLKMAPESRARATLARRWRLPVAR